MDTAKIQEGSIFGPSKLESVAPSRTRARAPYYYPAAASFLACASVRYGFTADAPWRCSMAHGHCFSELELRGSQAGSATGLAVTGFMSPAWAGVFEISGTATAGSTPEIAPRLPPMPRREKDFWSHTSTFLFLVERVAALVMVSKSDEPHTQTFVCGSHSSTSQRPTSGHFFRLSSTLIHPGYDAGTRPLSSPSGLFCARAKSAVFDGGGPPTISGIIFTAAQLVC